MKRIFLVAVISFFISISYVIAQTNSLKQGIEQIISTKKATIGIAISGIEMNDTLSINAKKHLPMQSVFKFHIALAVLNEVEKGTLSLTQKIFIKKSDLLVNTWSPIREKYPNGNVQLSLAEVLIYTVSQSDNNGCDILLRLIGGVETANNYMHKIGTKDVAIQASEEEMHKAWNVQYTNWTTPIAATALLNFFYNRKKLDKKGYGFLWETMLATTTGKNRIKGQLPFGTPVVHKTGSSDTNKLGVTAAVNDIGIVTLPNGQHFAISIFVSNSEENAETNEKIISDISKATWDYFVNKIK